ncbi:helix-turn-helix domain-containing protein [Erythrobacter sp. W53]|uniref:helix-turn-helix transcriptional regulator n=1 Tax=Erythrobacteraceae TaxID=335929 RepID=UPI0036D3505A
MLFFDAIVRFSGVSLLLLLAMFAWTHRRDWASAPYLGLSCISVSALLLGYAPPELRPPEPVLMLVRFSDAPHLVFVWLFALSLFESGFKLRFAHIVVGVLYTAPIVWLRLSNIGFAPKIPDWILIYGSITSVALMGHLVYATLRGRADDLHEQRRAARVYFVIVVVLFAVAAALSELLPRSFSDYRWTIKAVSIWPPIVFASAWMLKFDRAAVHFEKKPKPSETLDARDKDLLKKLESAIEDGQAFRDPSLTIKALAKQLGVSQHRLRLVINTHLRYANFNSYINSFRVAEVQRAMAAPDTAHLPIITLAMDAGFKSLSPFNKAFKETAGITPTEFRGTLPNRVQ